MVSLIRNGPRMLIIASPNPLEFVRRLTAEGEGEQMPMSHVFDRAEEHHTILYIVASLKPKVGRSEILACMLMRQDSLAVMCYLMNQLPKSLVSGVRPAPQVLILRAIGDMHLALQKIQKKFGGEISNFRESIEQGHQNTTIIAMTNKSIHQVAQVSSLHTAFLNLEMDYATLKKELTMHAFSFLNQGDQLSAWKEFEIRIYDLYSAYDLQYERLIDVLDTLELGIVTGAYWSKDYPRFMMSVEVYSVHFLTYASAKEIKRILLGLEHLDNGTRLVDFDLFHKGKKVYWKEVLPKGSRLIRQEAGIEARQALIARCNLTTLERMQSFEQRLLEQRMKIED